MFLLSTLSVMYSLIMLEKCINCLQQVFSNQFRTLYQLQSKTYQLQSEIILISFRKYINYGLKLFQLHYQIILVFILIDY
jgi:hypothetical protein